MVTLFFHVIFFLLFPGGTVGEIGDRDGWLLDKKEEKDRRKPWDHDEDDDEKIIEV